MHELVGTILNDIKEGSLKKDLNSRIEDKVTDDDDDNQFLLF